MSAVPPPRLPAAALLLCLGAIVSGCACHQADVLRRVPIPEVSTPQFEDAVLTADPREEDPETADCVLNSAALHCIPGVGAYVCNTCPGASDANPGTAEQPLMTIGAGIGRAAQSGLSEVFVANRSASQAAVYREQVEMVEGISVRGRYVAGSPWSRTGATRTVVENLRPEGLSFGPGILRTTVLSGFEVRSAGAVGGATQAAAVSVFDSSPSLVDLAAGELVPGAQVPLHTVGILVRGSSGKQAIPLIKGLSFSTRTHLYGGGGKVSSIGLGVHRAHVDVQHAEVEGGSPSSSGASRGVQLKDASGRIRDSVVVGGAGSDCVGIEAHGELSTVLIHGNWITGCRAASAGASSRGAGVLFHGCEGKSRTMAVQANPAITGGLVPGGLAAGVAALDGCALAILDNPNISGGAEAARAVGVYCANQKWEGGVGRDSPCTVGGNLALGGLSAGVTESNGILCEGSCANSDQACRGSCAELYGNEVNATAGLNLTHVVVRYSSPLIRQNRIGLGGAGVACLHRTTLRGLSLESSGSRVENNFVHAGPCEDVVAMVQINALRTGDGSWVEPDVHSNTIVGGGSSASTTGSSSYGVLLSTPGTVAPPPLGRYRNNIFVGGQNNHRLSFAEGDAFSDPRELRNNAFHNFYRSNGPNPVVYLDEGSSKLLTAGDINGRTGPDAEANLSVDPVFVNTFFDFHLQPVSPLLRMGTDADAPAEDLDGDLRPAAPRRPTIGADEP